MLGSWLFPLAPAAGLLLSAFILYGLLPWLPADWRIRRDLGAPVLVGLCLLSVLFVPVSFTGDDLDQELTLLSGWNFSTTDSVAALTVRADVLSLPFLLVTLLSLLAVTLLNSDLDDVTASTLPSPRLLGWLLMGAAACVLFVSANGLTVLYTVVAFDVVTVVVWISKGQRNTGASRLFLGVFSGIALVVATLTDTLVGQYALALVLWLRLGFYPLAEFAVNKNWPDDERLAYLVVSLGVGLYLVARIPAQSLPLPLLGLVAVTMLLGGALTWLAGGALSSERWPAQHRELRTRLVAWLGVTLALLSLLAVPLSVPTATAFAFGLLLSVVALWATPALGRPKFAEGAWSWPYLPAIMATVTLVGVPLSLGWVFRAASYEALFRVDSLVILLVVALAEALAVSGLIFYWRGLVSGQEQNLRRSMVGIIAMVPFLTPGLGPFILFSMVSPAHALFDFQVPAAVIAVMVGVLVLAAVLGYYRPQLQARLTFGPAAAFVAQTSSQDVLRWAERLFYLISRMILRLQLVLEGQHYMAWAMFVALVGMIIILLS